MVYSTPQKKRGRDGTASDRWGGSFDERDYPAGAIKRIRVENFMTYRDATVYPGPRLNLVLGPNGSGKSSIVCAVGLALCCAPKRLGRSDNLREFVRKGAKAGSVEVIISAGPDAADHRIERHLTADGKSQFKINGAAKTQKDVEKLNGELTIQLDNLCQFLPQEKVVEFSKMTPTELLLSTERAIGDGRLADMHERLITGGNKVKDLADKHQNTARQLANKQRERDAMKRDVEKIEEHDKLVLEAAELRARAAQLREHAAAAANGEAKAAHDAKQHELAKLEGEVKSGEGPKKRVEERIVATRQQEKQAEKQAERHGNAIAQLEGDTLEAMENEAGDLQDKLQSCVKDEEERQQRLAVDRKVHSAVLDDIERLPAAPPGVDPAAEAALREQKAAVAGELRGVGQEKQNVLHAREEPQRVARGARQALERMQAVGMRRMQELERRTRGITEFTARVNELREEGRTFKGNVYGPVATELRLAPGAPAHAAKALEVAIASRFLTMFVTEEYADNDAIRALAKKMGVRANVTRYGGNPHAPVQHPLARSDALERHGAAPLDTLFECPHVVKLTLCDLAGLNRTLLVESEAAVEEVFGASDCRLVFTPQNRHQKTVSRYNKSGVSFGTSRLRPPHLLNVSIDEAAVAAQQRRVQAADAEIARCEGRHAELQAVEAQLEQRAAAVDDQLQAASEARRAHERRRAGLRVKLEKLEKQIKRLEGEAPLLQKPKLDKQLKQLAAAAAARLRSAVDTSLRGAVDAHKSATLLAARRAALMEEKLRIEAEMEAGREGLGALKAEVAALQAAAAAAKAAYDARRAAWRELSKNLSRGALEKLAEVEGDAAACEERAEERAAAAARMTVGDRGVMQRYHRLVADANAQEALAQQLEAELLTMQGELAEAKTAWLPELKAKVAAVSDKFSHNFARLGSVGEVGLHETGEEYAQYAIHIRVKFRDAGDLETLSSSRHSGGEKSVSTIMYLLSLQNITRTPFRVVDEINQGMDSTNERKVFQAMVDAATERNTAQCLLMTPKLLPQLQYSEHVNVLAILNGAHIHEAKRALVPSEQLDLLLGQHAPGADALGGSQ